MTKEPKLLTRDEFRNAVFERDAHKCVLCAAPAQDAHHILERRLWTDSGYYLENGASVCGPCHLKCEATLVSCDELRERCGITRLVVPEHLYADADSPYDKWGNPILPNGQRMMGELFTDASVQKILAPVLHLFTNRVKYPRTYHLSWSPGVTKDDRALRNNEAICYFQQGQDVVVTAKMDGECTTFYRDGLHARSLTYDPHPSRDWIRALHARVSYEIPETWRICGENLYARHSISYQNLSSYFQVFSIWDGLRCLPWDETVEWCKMLSLRTVPVLYRGTTWTGQPDFRTTLGGDELEGYVVRLAEDFQYGAFRKSVAKYVRANHVQTHGHWMRSQVVPNGLAS